MKKLVTIIAEIVSAYSGDLDTQIKLIDELSIEIDGGKAAHI